LTRGSRTIENNGFPINPKNAIAFEKQGHRCLSASADSPGRTKSFNFNWIEPYAIMQFSVLLSIILCFSKIEYGR
jgi:hypothetical protein